MKVLVHFDSMGNIPFGIWWLDSFTAGPRCEYLSPDGPEAVRGKLIVFSKQNSDVSWSDWFDELTTRSPYFEEWVTYDSMGMSPHQLLRSLASDLAS
jgi:hypothetical protein